MSSKTYVLFDLAGARCALPRHAVREILPLPRLHAPPAAGDLLAGFLDLAGSPVPVIDLVRLFDLHRSAETDAYRHLVLLSDAATALLVDRVLDLVTVDASAVRPIGDARTFNGCVEAEIALGDRLVHALAPERVVTLEERRRLDALTRRAAARLASLPTA